MARFLRTVLLTAMGGVIGVGMAYAAASAAEGPGGTYQRKNGDLVRVWVKDKLLYCQITKGKKQGFEMCHGMHPEGDAWVGKGMKHPKMPGFMTFNGTVVFEPTGLSIKGCAMGICDKETWTKVG